MRKKVQDIMDQIRTDMSSLGFMPEELVIVLDNDQTWLDTVKERVGENANVRTISDEQQFTTVIRTNGTQKLVLDILDPEVHSIKMAEEMGLGQSCGCNSN